jgi:hypothetical protein
MSLSYTGAGAFATARKGPVTLTEIQKIRQRFPRAGTQFIAMQLGRSMEDVRRLEAST